MISDTELANNFNRLKNAVLLKRPILKEILAAHGARSLLEYVKGYVVKQYIPANLSRQKELVDVIREETSKLLGESVAADVSAQLQDYYYASTTDHFGPMYHPWVFNFNLAASAAYLEDENPILKNVITLACANVSLNNFSFPRGFAFNSDATGKNTSNRFSFLPSNSHSLPVYGFRPYQSAEIEKVKKSLKEAVARGDIRPEEAEKTGKILDEIYNVEDIFSCKYYADQITKTNFTLWKKIMPESAKEINFVYLGQERIVARLLIKYHLDAKTTISRIIYDDLSEELLTKYFLGLPEAFSRREKIGTYLFWAQPKNSKSRMRLKLWREGNFLVSEDSSYRIELTAESLRRALEEKELIPSVLLTFIVICFYYGLKCFGGLGQINYLPLLKKAYIQMHKDLGRLESAAACENTETSDLGGEVTAALISSKNNGTAPATSFDFLLHGDKNTWPILVDQLKKVTLEEAILPMFPEDYPLVYPQNERDPALSAIKPKDITKIIGLDQKLEACVKM